MRERLPTRRDARTFSIEYDGTNWHITYSKYPDGRVAEVFLHGSKAGSYMAQSAYSAGVALSIAFQHGAEVGEIADACARLEDGDPADLIGAVCDALYEQEQILEGESSTEDSPRGGEDSLPGRDGSPT